MIVVHGVKAVAPRIHRTGELNLLRGLEQPSVMAPHHPQADHRTAEPGSRSPWLHAAKASDLR